VSRFIPEEVRHRVRQQAGHRCGYCRSRQEYVLGFLLEYPAGGSDLAMRLTETRLERGPDGLVRAPTVPRLGVRPNLECVREYLQPVRTEAPGGPLYQMVDICDQTPPAAAPLTLPSPLLILKPGRRHG